MRSTGADEAGMQRYVQASFARVGYLSSLFFQKRRGSSSCFKQAVARYSFIADSIVLEVVGCTLSCIKLSKKVREGFCGLLDTVSKDSGAPEAVSRSRFESCLPFSMRFAFILENSSGEHH